MLGLTTLHWAAIGTAAGLFLVALVGGYLRHTNADDEPTAETDAGVAAGERIGNILALSVAMPCSAVYTAVTTFGAALVSRIPFLKGAFWQGLVEFATYRYQKAKGADAVALHHHPTGITPLAVEWQEGEETEEQRGWKIIGEDTVLHAGTEGRDTERLGKANVILTDGATAQSARPFELSVAEALDLERVEGLISGAEVQVTQMDVWPEDPDTFTGEGAAVADGGTAEPELIDRQTEMNLHASEAGLADSIVNLAGDGRISLRKYRDFLLEQVGSERLELAEDRGYAAGVGQERGNEVGAMLKGFLIAGGVFVLYKLGPMALQMLFGGGGGSGGGGSGVSIPGLFAHAPDLLVGLGV